MAKKPTSTIDPAKGPPPPPPPADGSAPEPGPYYPGKERFGDWDMDNIIPVEPGETLVNDDPEGDPNKFANQGEQPKK